MNSEVLDLEVLLSTYNGESYVKEQIDSIISQLNDNQMLLIRDDGSTDLTLKIIQEYNAKHKNVRVLELGQNVGVTKSFGLLMQASKANYNLLCDQDDIWKPTKIDETIRALKNSEIINSCNEKMPCLVVSEMACVDHAGKALGKKFTDIHKVSLCHNNFNQLLIQNIVTGAACGFNSMLREIALVGIEHAHIHDWWIGLCAASQGKIHIIDEPLVQYRLHQSNVVGANSVNLSRLYSIVRSSGVSDRVSGAIDVTTSQAIKFNSFHGKNISNRDKELLMGFISFRNNSFIGRRWWLIRNGVKFSSLFRNIALFLFVK